MRLEYASKEADPSDIEAGEVYKRVAARRLPHPLIPLDLGLLHAPPVADGYNSFIGALRTKTVIPAALLELSICRVGHLNGAVYEWNVHGPLACKARLSIEQLQGAATLPPFTNKQDRTHKAWESSLLTRVQQAVLKYTDEVIMRVTDSDEVFREVRQALGSDRQVVELTATIDEYNCVSRNLVALDIGEHSASRMKSAHRNWPLVVDGRGSSLGRIHKGQFHVLQGSTNTDKFQLPTILMDTTVSTLVRINDFG